MSSEKTNPKKRDEKRYYEPIRDHLSAVFANRYLDSKKFPYQNDLLENRPKNPYLEVVGGISRFSETLKKVFDYDTLNIIRNEEIYPDIVGYVQKDPLSPKEIIIVEVKDDPISLKMVAKTKFYEDVFNAKFVFLISTKEISEERVRFLLKSHP